MEHLRVYRPPSEPTGFPKCGKNNPHLSRSKGQKRVENEYLHNLRNGFVYHSVKVTFSKIDLIDTTIDSNPFLVEYLQSSIKKYSILDNDLIQRAHIMVLVAR